MLKLIANILLLVVVAQQGYGDFKCALDVPEIPMSWSDMQTTCVDHMRHHIQEQVEVSYQYLAMAAYFSRDTVNRPGFAKYFFRESREERDRAAKLILYLSMRGPLTDHVSDLITLHNVAFQEWADGTSALEDALGLETKVTKSIRKLIQACESKPDLGLNDYHLVHLLTVEYLEDQLLSERELSGKLVTLKKMLATHGQLGEFLFDKKLL